MKIRTDFVSNSSSSSYVFVIRNGSYEIGDRGCVDSTADFEDFISRIVSNAAGEFLEVIPDDEFEKTWVNESFSRYCSSLYNVKLHAVPQSAVDAKVVVPESVSGGVYVETSDIDALKRHLMIQLNSSFSTLKAVEYHVDDWNDELNDFQDESADDSYTGECLFYDCQSNH